VLPSSHEDAKQVGYKAWSMSSPQIYSEERKQGQTGLHTPLGFRLGEPHERKGTV
jgi:hypothetical protein